MQVIPEHSSVYDAAQQVTGRSTGAGRQAAKHTCGSIAVDFLRHSFLPLCSTENAQLPDKETTEFSYLTSLEKLTGFYGIETPDITGKPYPYNILYSHWAATRMLKKLNAELNVQIISKEGQAVLATEDRLDTNHSVFYVPVEPLYKLSKSKVQQDRKAFAILLSVCSYLYHTAQIPYYTAEDTYMYWQYEMIEEWFVDCEDDWEAESFLENRKAISEAKRYGGIMERKIYDTSNLKYFKKRLGSILLESGWQVQCLAIGKRCHALMEQYPEGNLYNHIHAIQCEDPESEDYYEYADDGYIYPEQYVSFVATADDWLGQTLVRNVSDELNQYGAIQEPIIKRVFDDRQQDTNDSIAYERKLFDLISDLYHLLKQIP